MSTFDPNQKPKAILIDVVSLETPKEEALKRLEELENLVKTFGGVVIVRTIQKRGFPDYETFIGKGKLNEIIEIARENHAKLLILNNILKPGQIFNLNEMFSKERLEMEAWDRIDLILRIFSKHAKSSEALLQIELAGIRHMGPRIIGLGTELARQEGAKGVRAGQGETNIEIMKRHLRAQEQKILEKLRHYETIKEGHRKRRKRQNLKTVALIGYTNAGKSSLLKSLTGKNVYIADELFATLDTRVGKLYIPPENHLDKNGNYDRGTEILVSDTIGFIQNLPPSLISAFKSTLAETIDADLLLHVIDISDPQIDMKIKVVEEILEQLGLANKQKIYVFNKIDLIDYEKFLMEDSDDYPDVPKAPPGALKAGKETAAKLGWVNFEITPKISPLDLAEEYKKFSPVFVSAEKKTNLSILIESIKKIFSLVQ